jgi:hypothetical protein
MKAKKLATWALLIFVGVSVAALIYKEVRSKPAAAAAAVATTPTGSRVVAYYFHGAQRCVTCRTIERYSQETIEKRFADPIQKQRLEFRPVNVDESKNRHFVQDYKLETRSLVIALFKDGQQQKWKTLDDVWLLVDDHPRFEEYVAKEVGGFLQELH